METGVALDMQDSPGGTVLSQDDNEKHAHGGEGDFILHQGSFSITGCSIPSAHASVVG